MVTPLSGYIVDPTNSNGVIKAPEVSPVQTTTLAQDQAKTANQGKPGYDVLGNPIGSNGATAPVSSKSITPTVISGDMSETNANNNQKVAQASANMAPTVQDNGMKQARENGGTYTGQDGNLYYNYDSTPVSGQGSMIPGTTLQSTGDLGVDNTLKQINDLKTQMDFSSAAMITNIQNQYQNLIAKQQDANTRSQASEETSLLMSGSSRYAGVSSAGLIHEVVSQGLDKISSLNSAEQSALLAAQQAQQSNDYKLLDRQLSIYDELRQEKAAATQKLSEQLQVQNQKIQDQKAQVSKDNAVAQQFANGVTSPSTILKNLQAAGNTTISAKDISDSISNLNPDQKTVYDTLQTAAKNGATSDVLATIGKATNLTDAIKAAGQYMQDPTSPAGQYSAYIKDAQSKGKSPVDYQTYQATQKYLDAYNQAKGTAAGKAAVDAQLGLNPDGTPTSPQQVTDSNSQSILSQTGLSLTAFNYLTQGTGALSRLPAAQRNHIMSETQNFLNKNGIDVSTFQSQYKAYNDVLQKNVERANATKVFAGEVSGSADALIQAIDQKDMGNIRASNILGLITGKEVNDPTTQKYSFQLQAMANDLAGYFASSRGATAPELQDQKDAANLIANGMSKRSVVAFKDSINSNEEKVNKVVQNAVDSTQKQVWNLFGVGDKFQSKPVTDASTLINYSEDEAKNAITTAIHQGKADQGQITKILGQTNPETGQPYTYLDAVQITGLDIPSIGSGDAQKSDSPFNLSHMLKFLTTGSI